MHVASGGEADGTDGTDAADGSEALGLVDSPPFGGSDGPGSANNCSAFISEERYWEAVDV